MIWDCSTDSGSPRIRGKSAWMVRLTPVPQARPDRRGRRRRLGRSARTARSVRRGVRSGEFQLPIADVFTISGRGVVVVGQVAAGACRSGDAAVVVGADGASVVGDTTIVGIEAFRKRVDVARQGDMVGLMLRGVSREQVHAGDIVVVRQ